MTELASPQAEQAVIGTLLSQPHRTSEIVTELAATHFASPACSMLYASIHDAFFANKSIDPVSIAGPLARALADAWGLEDEAEAVGRVNQLANSFSLAATPVTDHAALIRRYAERRLLGKLAEAVKDEVERDEMDPGAIAALISQRALNIASHTVVASELTDFGDAGRHYIRTLQFEIEATKRGIDLGVKTGLRAIDDFTRGRRPGRLYITAGEPGAGKSAVEWIGALNFATAQGRHPEHERKGTLILSMEMGDQDSSSRFAQHLAHLDGELIQDGNVSARDMERLVREWAQRRHIPLYLNYAPNLKCSQMLALIAEAIRRHNICYVLLDHFRTFDLDRRLDNKNDEDEEKARFLKEQIARAMHVAVVCIAHTRKPSSDHNAGRPQMADLRGSGQISAHADMVSFLYRPISYANQKEIDLGEVSETDAEMIHRKNRQGLSGTGSLYFDPSTMNIR